MKKRLEIKYVYLHIELYKMFHFFLSYLLHFVLLLLTKIDNPLVKICCTVGDDGAM